MKKNQLLFMSIALSLIYFLSNCTRVDDAFPSNSIEKDGLKSSSIEVSISEQINVDHLLCDTLGVANFSIDSGSYYLTFDNDNKYGKAVFSIHNGSNIQNSPGVGVKVKVARRNAPKCPTCSCCCGVGFRCGFVTWDPPTPSYSPYDADRYIDATIQILNGNLVVQINEELPIGEPGWEI